MSSNFGQTQRSLQQQKMDLERNLETQQDQEKERGLEGFDSEQGFSADQAFGLQPHMGNMAIQDLMDKLSEVDQALDAYEEEHELTQEEDLDLEAALEGQSIGGGGGGNAGGAGGSGNPWDMSFFFGGDDDDEEIEQLLKRKRNRQKENLLHVGDIIEEEEFEYQHELGEILGMLPTPKQGKRSGDALYQAVEASLQSPELLCSQSLLPEDLRMRRGVADPIRTPVEIGRFLSSSSRTPLARSLAELIAGPASSLVAPQGGFSTAIARIATLAVCAEVAEGGASATDKAVSLSLRQEVWQEAVAAARSLAQKGALNAPDICAFVLKEDIRLQKEELPIPSALGGAALKNILPEEMGFTRPTLALKPPEKVETDPLLFLLDSAVRERTNYTPPSSSLENQAIQPALQIANRLLSALGRTQVELAAAAIALRRIEPSCRIVGTLQQADTLLRGLAQGVVKSGKILESLKNKPLSEVKPQAEKAITSLAETIPALRSLRNWGLSTLAGELSQ
jgi:hypothetical protein